MHYFINGGRDERGLVKSAAARTLYSELKVKRILFIPLAIVEDFWQELWHDRQDLFGMPDYEIQALTTLDTDPKKIEQKITWADMIYFPGGAQSSLLKRAQNANIVELINKAKTSGSLKLLAGGSAGAMVMGTDCIVGHTDIKSVVPGLNFMPGYVIDSHFSNRNRETRLQKILADRPSLIGLGLDEDTAVVMNQELALQAVFGPGTVKVFHKTNIETYDSTSSFPI